MPTSTSSLVTELALRAATNTGSRDVNDSGTQANSIKETALQHAQGMVASGSNGAAVPQFGGLQEEAIALALVGVTVAYSAITAQVAVLKDKRLCFDKEREAGIATFMIPNNKEETDLYNEEKVMKDFLDMAMSNSVFSKYLGIHSADLATDKTAKFFSVLPFYRMSEALAQPVSSSRPLDRQRTAINLFFRSAMPDAIADIDNGFQAEWKFVSFWRSAFQRRNYLNSRRAPRFIMMCMSNLLWNLQHPVDPETGFPLSLSRSIEMCRKVELFLNQLLNANARPYLEELDSDENCLMSFMRKLEVYTKGLRAAYVQEQLHEVNFDEITNSAHRTLRIMDKSVFKLIYKKYNPVTKKNEADEKAAETLADSISYINELLCDDPHLFSQLGPAPRWIPKAAGANIPPQTIIDLLIIFCHLSWHERDHMLDKLSKSAIPGEIEFYHALKKFDRKFIKPIKAVCKEDLGATYWSPKYMEVGKLTARRIIPFITLVIEDYRLDVDTLQTYELANRSQTNLLAPKILTGRQQVQNINLAAQKGNKNTSYYYWELSPYIKGTTALDDLPKYQYRMTQVTQLMDSVRELVENYRSFLLKKGFQSFLLKCLDKVSVEILELESRVEEADQCLDNSKRVSRGLMAILRPLTTDLDSSLEGFRSAMTDFKKVVSAPDFIARQHRELTTKVSAIAEQYKALFNENSGLIVLLESMEPLEESVTPPPSAVQHESSVIEKSLRMDSKYSSQLGSSVDSGEVVALRGVVQTCHDALSYQSKTSRKGILLRELLETIDHQPNFTERQIIHVIIELTRVTASERKTWFFQAGYGHTRSAKALMAAIKDPKVNKSLPLAAIILGEPDVKLSKVNDAHILQRFERLHDGNRRWQDLSSNMRLGRLPESVVERSKAAPAA